MDVDIKRSVEHLVNNEVLVKENASHFLANVCPQHQWITCFAEAT